MRYLLMTNGDTQPADETMYVEMGKFVAELSQQGVLLATGGLEPTGFSVTSRDGEITITDGPFAEAKEAIAGFALIDVRSAEEAVELSRRFWKIAGNGSGRIQRVIGPEDF